MAGRFYPHSLYLTPPLSLPVAPPNMVGTGGWVDRENSQCGVNSHVLGRIGLCFWTVLLESI